MVATGPKPYFVRARWSDRDQQLTVGERIRADPGSAMHDQLLAGTFASAGMDLEAVGVDPYNDITEVALQLHRPRYERMTRYFESIGPSGIRMMRQTASLQINIDAGRLPAPEANGRRYLRIPLALEGGR